MDKSNGLTQDKKVVGNIGHGAEIEKSSADIFVGVTLVTSSCPNLYPQRKEGVMTTLCADNDNIKVFRGNLKVRTKSVEGVDNALRDICLTLARSHETTDSLTLI